MAELARALSLVVGRPVIDQTGFGGTFDIQMVFATDMATTMASHDSGPASSERPSIFVAIQEQLGLKLKSSNAPVEILVIDHVEKPLAN